MADSHPHNADEYLMTIYLLANPVGEYVASRQGPPPTLAVRIAETLGVTRASAGEMLQRLERDGLVRRGQQREVLLTDTGSATAERIVRRHRIVERMLTDLMGYSAPEAHEKADGLDDAMDDEMIDRLWNRLGQPDRCPHGYPIDPAHELAENPTLRPLDEIVPGSRAQVVRLAEHDGELLRFYYDAGLAPGTQVEVLDSNDDGGVTVQLDRSSLTLEPVQARGAFVLPLA
jgi:DtxR family Mn-dependent transcriptional regulator